MNGRTGRVLRTLPALAWAAGIWWLSSTPDDGATWLAISWLDGPGLDKVAHAGLFGVLAALLRLAGASPLAAVAAAIGWGVVDEIHQSFVPGRTPELGDLLADAVGAVAAVLAVRWLASRRADARYSERPERRSEP